MTMTFEIIVKAPLQTIYCDFTTITEIALTKPVHRRIGGYVTKAGIMRFRSTHYYDKEPDLRTGSGSFSTISWIQV